MELTLIGLAPVVIGVGTSPFCQHRLSYANTALSAIVTATGIALSLFGIISILR